MYIKKVEEGKQEIQPFTGIVSGTRVGLRTASERLAKKADMQN